MTIALSVVKKYAETPIRWLKLEVLAKKWFGGIWISTKNNRYNHISWESTLVASLVNIGGRLRSVERSTRFVSQTHSLTDRHTDFIITGSAVALHCCKAHSEINRKRGNSTPCKIVTPKNFNLKLCTRDYVGEATHHANFGFNRYSIGRLPI